MRNAYMMFGSGRAFASKLAASFLFFPEILWMLAASAEGAALVFVNDAPSTGHQPGGPSSWEWIFK
jgi:hypothetical protein